MNVKHSTLTADAIPKQVPEALRNFIMDKGGNKTNIFTTHKKYNADDEYVGDETFDLDLNESDGTRKAFSFSGPLLDVLQHGKILVVDELDAMFHPIITGYQLKVGHFSPFWLYGNFTIKRNLRSCSLIEFTGLITPRR